MRRRSTPSPAPERAPPAPAPNAMLPPHDPETGEVIESSPPPTPAATTASSEPHAADEAVPDEDEDERILRLDDRLEQAAEQGMAALQALWLTLAAVDRRQLKGALDGRHKPRAEAVDRERA